MHLPTSNHQPSTAAIVQAVEQLPWSLARVRLKLIPSATSRIPPHQAALFYAMLCDAHHRATGEDSAMPDGVMLRAPDQAIRWVSPKTPLSLGLSVLAADERRAHQTLEEVVSGLRSLGRDPAKGQTLRKFHVDCIFDVVQGRNVQSAGQAKLISKQHLLSEFARLSTTDECTRQLTVQFQTPLRCMLPKSRKRDGHGYFDDTVFPVQTFLNRLRGRLHDLDFDIDSINDPQRRTANSQAQVHDNQLVWLDIGYGKEKVRKTLGGVVGSITLMGLSVVETAMLVLGQYVHVGENTRFGFGGYRITELGPDPFPIERTTSLLRRAIEVGDFDRIASESNLASGVLGQALAAVEQGDYEPGPHFQVEIPKASGGTRILSIPPERDRAVQRVVLSTLDEGIDAFLESSSMAYRRGLGRTQAAREIRRAHRDGFAWAVKADFFNFFDSVSHDVLTRRLSAYLACPQTVRWIMTSVRAGSPQPDRGLPTGSPLSPALANLFLDQFDERVQATGARLIRYADDFLILCRTEEAASELHAKATAEAAALQLALNSDKTSQLALRDGFKFLGFEFQMRDKWQAIADDEPQLIEQIEWEPAKKAKSASKTTIHLPGESDWQTTFRQATVIVAEEVERVRKEAKNLVFEMRSGAAPVRTPLTSVRELISSDQSWIEWSAVRALTEQGSSILVVDTAGRIRTEISPPEALPRATATLAQVELFEDQLCRLHVARELVASKLHNYAVLATRCLKRTSGAAHRLFDLSQDAVRVDDLPSLLGLEGAGAALWYGRFAEALAKDFSFERRVAPDASDPVNVMLNLGQTVLHRWITLWVERCGLVTSIGVFHQPRPGHASLVSDLQEPFRHVIDRSVIEASHALRATDFRADPDGPFPLRIGNRARVEFLGILYRNLNTSVAAEGQQEPRSYIHQVRSLTLTLRDHMLNRSSEFRSFWHPSPVSHRQ